MKTAYEALLTPHCFDPRIVGGWCKQCGLGHDGHKALVLLWRAAGLRLGDSLATEQSPPLPEWSDASFD